MTTERPRVDCPCVQNDIGRTEVRDTYEREMEVRTEHSPSWSQCSPVTSHTRQRLPAQAYRHLLETRQALEELEPEDSPFSFSPGTEVS